MHSTVLFLIALIIIAVLFFVIGPNVIFLVLALLLAFVLWKRNNDLKKNIYKMPEDALHIVNVDKGGIFQIRGVGKELEDMTLKVMTKHLYQQGDYYWWELECDKGGGEKVWVEVEDDDDTVVSVVLKKLKLNDINMTPEKLVIIDDEEEGLVIYNNVRYNYEDSDEAIFYRYCDDSKPEKFYYWDFAENENYVGKPDNNNYLISVEKWGEKDYEVFYCQLIKPNQITVLATRSNGEAK